jgi:hypothetical protein
MALKDSQGVSKTGTRARSAAGLLGGLLRRIGTKRSLRVDGLLASARRQTGLADFGDSAFLAPLRLLVDSTLREAGLSAAARARERWWLVEILKRRLYIERDLARHPEILRLPIAQPIFVTGMPRSGTTLLHNLLLAGTDCRWLREWEVEEPWPDERPAGRDPRERARAERLARQRSSQAPAVNLDAIHALDSPADCDVLFMPTFVANLQAVTHQIPSYERWLLELPWDGWTSPYTYYRRQLQRLSWYAPGARWALKSPVHLGNLRALLGVFPDATVVHLHRDPARAVPSTCSMVAAQRLANHARVDRAAIGQFILRRLAKRVDAALVARELLPPARFRDVQYQELLRDPLSTMEQLYAGCGLPLTAEARRRMSAFLAANPQHKRGVHRYQAADFGLDDAQLDRAFAAYRERFAVQPETP